MVHPSQEDFCRLWGRLIAQAWADPAFKKRLVANPAEVLQEHGYELPSGMNVHLQVVASDDNVQYLYIPCPEELRNNSSTEAGEVASDCLNNRVVLARLTAESRSRR
jgi:hypothetical protein